MEFTKEELVQLIKDTIAETQAENACAEEEKKEEVVNEEPAAEEKPAEEKPAANACSDEDEVVKAEALNSSSEKQVALQAVKEPEWANLHGAEFFSELRKHPEWR